MPEELNKPKPNLKEIAQAQRHLSLVNKLQRGVTLSKKEIDEIGELENATKKKSKPWIVGTQEEVAEAIGVSTRRVRYMKRAGMPVEDDGRYNVVLIERWRHKITDGYTGWDEKNKEMKYKILETKFSQMTGDLVKRTDVEAQWTSIIIGLKTALMALPNYVAPKLAMLEPRLISAVLREHITEILKELCGMDEEMIQSENMADEN